MQLMIELRWFILNDFMFQLDVPLQGSFRAVEPIATCIATDNFIQNVLVASPLHLFAGFQLSTLNFQHVFEQFHHHLTLSFGLLDLPLQKLLPFGQKNQLFRWMHRFETFDICQACMLLCRTISGERQNGLTIGGIGEELISVLHQQQRKNNKRFKCWPTSQFHIAWTLQNKNMRTDYEKWFFYKYQNYYSEKYQLYSMLKKNFTKNIQTVSTRIITTNKLPKDFFPPIIRPARSLDIRKNDCQNSEVGKNDKDQQNNGLLFTFYRSRSSNLRLRPSNEVQQSKLIKQRQSCPAVPIFEQIWSKEDKQNNFLQKKGRTLYKITRKTLTLDNKKKNELKLDTLKY